MSLTAVEVDGSRVVLRTSGAPAYTSYSPSPGVFVVDLTSTNRDASVVVPATLPPAVASLSADDVVEMGSHLTRITLRLTQSLHPEVSAIEKAVVITIPATAIAIENSPSVEPLAAVVPTSEPVVLAEAPAPEPVVETIEPAPAPAPAPKAEDVSLPRARTLRHIAANARDIAPDFLNSLVKLFLPQSRNKDISSFLDK